MKISEVVNRLLEISKVSGDLDVYISYENYEFGTFEEDLVEDICEANSKVYLGKE